MSDELKNRFKAATVSLIVDLKAIQFPHGAYDIKRQLLRGSSSSAANYRAACRAKSEADFVYKLSIVEEECDETLFWLELLRETDTLLPNHKEHEREFNELLSIIIVSIRKLKNKRKT